MAAFPSTPIDWFWTSSLATDNPSAAWYVYFYFGYPKTDDMTNSFSVRCVRSERPPVALGAHYDVRAHEVLDLATGLRWQRTPAPKPLAFRAAGAYCDHLKLGAKQDAKSGWRVPTLVELLTLIDEAAAAPMIDRAAFPDTPGEPFWTSSTFANGAELAWYVGSTRATGSTAGSSNRFAYAASSDDERRAGRRLRAARAAEPIEGVAASGDVAVPRRGKHIFGVGAEGAAAHDPVREVGEIDAIDARVDVRRVPIQRPLRELAGQIELPQRPAPSVAVPTGAMLAALEQAVDPGG